MKIKKIIPILLSGFIMLQSPFNVFANEAVFIDETDSTLQEYLDIQELCVMMYKNSNNDKFTQSDIKADIHALTNKSISATDIAKKICYNSDLSKEEFIKTCYKVLINKNPDEKTLEDWIYKLNIGFSKDSVFSFLTLSDEYQEICENANIRYDVMEDNNYRDKDISVTAYVNNLLKTCYERTPSTSEMESICQELIETQNYKEVTSKIITESLITDKEIDIKEFIQKLDIIFESKTSEETINQYISSFEKGEINYNDIVENYLESNQFLSKMKIHYTDVLYFGDGNSIQSDLNEEDTFSSLLAKELNIPVHIMDYKGSTFCQNKKTDSLLDYVDSIDYSEDYKLVFIEAGLNDWVISAELGDIDSRNEYTMCGALNILLTEIQEKLPNSDIYVLGLYNTVYDEQINGNAMTPSSWSKFINKMTLANNCHYINLSEYESLNFSENINKYSSDGIHLNEKANEEIFKVIYENVIDSEKK